MAMTMHVILTESDGTIAESVKEANIKLKPQVVHMYEVEKKEKVSAKKVVALVMCMDRTGTKVVASGGAVQSPECITGVEAREKLGLPAEGDGYVEPEKVPTGFKAFVQSTSANRKILKGAPILLLSGCNPAKRKAEVPKRVVKSAKTGVDINKLLAKFEANGTAGPPAAEKDLPKGKAPHELKAMMLASGEWVLKKTNQGMLIEMLAFFEKGKMLDKVQLFGDKDMTEDWAKENETPNCAQEGWECFGAAGEHHFLFVNMASGATRCANIEGPDDMPLTAAPFSEFMHLVEDYTTALKKQDTSGGDDALDFKEYADEHANS